MLAAFYKAAMFYSSRSPRNNRARSTAGTLPPLFGSVSALNVKDDIDNLDSAMTWREILGRSVLGTKLGDVEVMRSTNTHFTTECMRYVDDHFRGELMYNEEFGDIPDDMNLFDWMGQWTQGEQMVRGTLGRMLFSNDEILKSVKVISGGEQGRMLFGKLILQKPNVLVMDEPTNHLDMESIESLNTSLEKFKGTLVFVSHDREFVSSLATRILEIRMDGSVVNYLGNYEEYLSSQGID